MNWAETHAYVAAWLSPLIALVALAIQNNRQNVPKVDWSRVVFYVIVLTAVAVAVSPGFDTRSKTTADMLAIFGFVTLIADVRSRP